MLGAGFQLTRGRHGDDPLHTWAKARRSNQRIDQLRRAQSDVSNGPSSAPHKQHKLLPNLVASDPSASSSSNLDRFLESVTPSVPAQFLSKTLLWERRADDDYKPVPYFVLGDVWDSFAEWSAYGTGVPLVLNNNKDRVIQYYVPSLSAIQIYAHSHALNSSRRPGDSSDSDFRDSSSDVSSDSDSEQLSARVDRISLRDEDSSSDDGEPLGSQGRLMFEYLERDLPYIREPLADKVFDLAAQFPQLMTLKSCDLLPSSWFSVAWYPIYRIPTGPTLKDLDACFLTYHSLHTPSGGKGSAQSMSLMQARESEKMSLPVFGLASYKFRGSLWTPIGGSEHQLVNSLFQAADKWLHSCNVNHPDFLFFCRR
ncbi:uncharacterized protein LOC9312807 isoform X2 [Arabidopsis lyrata subsp. lyrata]|uniref:uncharacterized protein LOC9312807 isoform X2 n=1 Tax=Arabidopsis lyrata subsp. lyrata TaxID=81972 RepID=UPI000A29AA62|nr:uncharacterized protein LOC9312807 isoform X2 [Arabidopsis lyrata subsp. lyrata]|eukprot:XP_020882523.1 uncharacterized protein LOC9312807 isoform X2 [Arabidopsis lyrata subsp. lyrata]